MNDTELKYLRPLQPVIREKMGEERNTDLIWCEVCRQIVTWEGHTNPECEYLRLPHAIDLKNPERGLAGMLKGYLYGIIPYTFDRWVVKTDAGECIADTPYLALLKALAAQEGVEVGE